MKMTSLFYFMACKLYLKTRGKARKNSYQSHTWKSRERKSPTWTALPADLSGEVLHVAGKVVKTVPVGHDFNAMQKHVCLVLKEVVFVLLEHDHVVLQLHLVGHRVQEERLEDLVPKGLSAAHEQEGLGAV